MRFARDLFVFGWANIASLVLNGVLSFLLPRYMTIEDFGYYRLFVLYASLAGIAHLGMLEGILVRWAEKPEDRVGGEIRSIFRFLYVQHVVLLVPLCIALVWLREGKWLWLGLALAVYILICNFSMLGQIALQARRQFSQLSFFTVLTSAALFVFVLAWKLLGRLDGRMAITSFVVANLLAGIGIWKIALKSGATPPQSFGATFKLGLENTRIGWRILVANFFVAFTPSLDRFFVSGTFPIRDFAIYAFAGNALAIVYTVAMSAARVVYPYLSGATGSDSRKRAYAHGRSMILGLWAVSLGLYFPMAYLVQLILPKYLSSLPLVRLLMISSGFVAMIHILHANYFRVSLALNRFLTGSLIGLFAVAALLAVVRREASLLWVAAAMIGGILVWWIANEVLLAGELGNSRMGWIGTLALWLLGSATFLGACAVKRLWIGGLVYALGCGLLLAFGLRSSLRSIFAQAFSLASRGEPGS
jgi:O-antigen/teichoic acid export membrane protein